MRNKQSFYPGNYFKFFILTFMGKIDVGLFIFLGVFNQNCFFFSDKLAVLSHFVSIFKKDPSSIFLGS